MIMIVWLLILIVLAAMMCVVYALAQNSTIGYVPRLKTGPGRHRAAHRAVGPSTAQLSRAAANLAAHQSAWVHREYERWLDSIAPVDRVDVLDFCPAPDHRYDVLATRVLDAKAHLERKGLRLRQASPWGTPEDADVWEPELVGAA